MGGRERLGGYPSGEAERKRKRGTAMGGSQKTASSSYIRRRDVSPSAQLDPSSDESWSVR